MYAETTYVYEFYIAQALACVALYFLAHNFLFPLYLKIMALFDEPVMSRPKDPACKFSIIMPVYNEEKSLPRKLENIWECLRSSGVEHEVLIGSDGSTDLTCALVEDFIQCHWLKNWKLFPFEKQGKGPTVNRLVAESTGDIIVSTDADTLMDWAAVPAIVEAFNNDNHLGCVSCVPRLQGCDLKVQSWYWNYEMRLRDAESRIGKLIVVTGWLYAFRKELFEDIPPEAMADDLWVPLTVVLKKMRSVQLLDLLAVSEPTDEGTEVRRRTRVITGGVDIVKRLFPRIVKDPVLFFLVFSHKINRWLLPLWLLLFVVSAAFTEPKVLWVYAVLLAVALLVLRPKRCFYLLYSVFSPILSFIKLLRQKDLSKWDHTRRK